MLKGVHCPASESQHHEAGHAQKNAIELRRQVQRLFFDEGWSKNQIARWLNVSKGFVVNWTQHPQQDPEQDRRGWPAGKHRRYDRSIVDRVRQLHAVLLADEREFFTGATAIALAWQRRYGDEAIPSLRHIGSIMAAEGLTTPRRGRRKGAARYLCYPETTLYETISSRLLEADFIGHKYLRGRSQPVNFLGLSFKKTPRLRWYCRIEGQTTQALLRQCGRFFEHFERPDAIKVDNAMAMAGSGRGKRLLSKFMHTMLSQEIIPIFAVPRQPFSQGSIEGNNSVFSRAFWNRHEFGSLEELDERLVWFNESSLRYCQYEVPKRRRRRQDSWLPRVYFLRQVREDAEQAQGTITVANETIYLDPALINYFVLAEWQPSVGELIIWFEKEQQAEQIAVLPFPLNKNCRYRL